MSKASKKDRHVVPNPRGGWAVRQSGATKASRVFESQKEAVTYARDLARKGGSELYVHRRDGTISDKNSYGSDPYPLKDKR
jgi:hypothetical protein